MASITISNLLNPVPASPPPPPQAPAQYNQLPPPPQAPVQYNQLPSPCSTSYTNDRYSSTPRPKKQKVSKDAAVFMRGKIRGPLNFPPCEYQNESLAAAHAKFQLHPMGHISEYPRHIPYNSEKKSFLEKTGRESFEVFQYTIRIPGDEKTYTVMWDYNIGLVRTTPLFRCNSYSKTTPAKMLNANPGLRDICHSITGGALAAQGYWMPFDAAKAVAATFCYRMREALTPLFGVDFISLCTKPHDPKFGCMIIDQATVRKATERANGFKLKEKPRPSPQLSINNSQAPEHAEYDGWNKQELRPKPSHRGEVAGPSGYVSDSDGSDDRPCPHPTPSASDRTHSSSSHRPETSTAVLPSPRYYESVSTPAGGDGEPNHTGNGTDSASGEESDTLTAESRSEMDEDDDIHDQERDYDNDDHHDRDYDYDEDTTTSTESPESINPPYHTAVPYPDNISAQAARLLLRLHMQETRMYREERKRKRRRRSFP